MFVSPITFFCNDSNPSTLYPKTTKKIYIRFTLRFNRVGRNIELPLLVNLQISVFSTVIKIWKCKPFNMKKLLDMCMAREFCFGLICFVFWVCYIQFCYFGFRIILFNYLMCICFRYFVLASVREFVVACAMCLIKPTVLVEPAFKI